MFLETTSKKLKINVFKKSKKYIGAKEGFSSDKN